MSRQANLRKHFAIAAPHRLDATERGAILEAQCVYGRIVAVDRNTNGAAQLHAIELDAALVNWLRRIEVYRANHVGAPSSLCIRCDTYQAKFSGRLIHWR